jgi:RNA polymerase sigma-70 factor (ECF subfamily)
MDCSEKILEDAELVDRTCAGDSSAFEILMRRHSGPVRRLIAGFFRNRALVDDLAQETFVKAFFGLKSFRKDCALAIWLKRIALRQCLDQLRKRKNEVVSFDKDSYEIAESSGDINPENQIKARLLLGKIMKSLAPQDRAILVLHYGEGYSGEEIAEITGLSKTNVKVRAFRIRQKLKAIFDGGYK